MVERSPSPAPPEGPEMGVDGPETGADGPETGFGPEMGALGPETGVATPPGALDPEMPLTGVPVGLKRTAGMEPLHWSELMAWGPICRTALSNALSSAWAL